MEGRAAAGGGEGFEGVEPSGELTAGQAALAPYRRHRKSAAEVCALRECQRTVADCRDIGRVANGIHFEL